MKIMTLNMWQGRLERVLLNHLKSLEVDFACTQEAVDCKGDIAGLATTYQKIGDSLGLNEQFFSPLIHSQLGGKDIYFGNAVYSNIPFHQTNTIFTRGEYKENFDLDSEDYNIRAFQHVEIEVKGKKLHLINHHGHHIDANKLGDEETLRQITQISDYIKELDGAIVLCADFNLSPESASIKKIDTQLINLSVRNSLVTTRSKLTVKDEVCDYIFVNDNVLIKDFSMDEAIISDHNALLLDFELK